MRILVHIAGVLLFGCIFVLGKLMIDGREMCAHALNHIPIPASYTHLCNFFLYSGRIFVGVAVVLGFLEVVAVMILTSGWIIDLLLPAML